jgi:hypothetical protein
MLESQASWTQEPMLAPVGLDRGAGKTQWLHVACTPVLTVYRTGAKRGEMLANIVGVVVHDRGEPSYTMQGGLHALCDAVPCANGRRWLKSRKRIGRARCGACCVAPVAPPAWRANAAFLSNPD